MSFGGNSGQSSIATGSDVALSNPANGQVLTYNASLAKWSNASGTSGSTSNYTYNGTQYVASTVARTFIGPVDPSTFSGLNVTDNDVWIPTT